MKRLTSDTRTPETGRRHYVVSQDPESGCWYCHSEGYSYIPVFGSISEKKSEAAEFAKMMNGLPNKVEEIYKRRRAEWERENGTE